MTITEFRDLKNGDKVYYLSTDNGLKIKSDKVLDASFDVVALKKAGECYHRTDIFLRKESVIPEQILKTKRRIQALRKSLKNAEEHLSELKTLA